MFNRLFRRKSQPVAKQPTPMNYGSLFDQVLNGLAAGWSAAQVKTCLAGRENDQGFIEWLFRYDQDIWQRHPNLAMAESMVRWGNMECGALGQMAGEMGQRAMASVPSPETPAQAQSHPQMAPETLFQQGNRAYQQGDFKAAIVAYDASLVIKPDFHAALNNKGACLAGLAQFEQAIAAYDAALELKPDYHQVFYRKGNALRNLGRFEASIAAYDAALILKPDYQEVLNNKGTALAALKRFEAAIAAYDAALSIEPQKYSCLNNKGMMLQQLGRLEDAIVAYDAALAINPKYSRARQNKAAVLQSLHAQ